MELRATRSKHGQKCVRYDSKRPPDRYREGGGIKRVMMMMMMIVMMIVIMIMMMMIVIMMMKMIVMMMIIEKCYKMTFRDYDDKSDED